MRATTTVTQTTHTPRPMFLSADARKLSYRSKSGHVLTLQLTNSKAADNPKQVAEKDQPKQGATNAASEAKEKQKQEAMWPGLFDTLSFWAAEAVEIAFFGPYDEPRGK
ncbi:hypothetical protein AC578_3344 [Pseudocercospora eumusae]|uniref:Uncharacterized protein n=1 Tax=Pseudocercospora eumusae TaxID=321146 RepID=A0A139HDC3_9PEZI|nr:hypothetical protein AC578_3344 [Pseudocercospora eumusae]